MINLLADVVQANDLMAFWGFAQIITGVVSIYLYIQAFISFVQALHSDRSQGTWQHAIASSGGKFLAPTYVGMLSAVLWGVHPPPIWK